MADDEGERDKSKKLEGALNILGKIQDKTKDAVDSLKKHEGNRAVEEIFPGYWGLCVKMLAFVLPFFLVTALGGMALTLNATMLETLNEVNLAVPDAKLIVFGILFAISLIVSWIFGLSHHGRSPFYYTRAGLIAGVAFNFIITVSPLGYRLINSIL